MVDTVPGSIATTARLTLDRSVYGDIDTTFDHDWYRIDLTAGQTYEFRLHGIGTGQLGDPTLRLRDAAGNSIAYNDDASLTRWDGTNIRDPYLEFTAPTTGSYFLDVGEFGDDATGRFLLTAATHLPNGMVFTPDEISWQSTNNYPTVPDFGGIDAAAWDLRSSATLTVNITGLTADGQFLARNALRAWTDVTGITFTETSGTANITFDDNASGQVARANYFVNGSTITSATVQISTGWLTRYGTGFQSYSFETYIHEIGHALGLGHAGNYDGSAVYGTDTFYLNDSVAYSIMSYMNARGDEFGGNSLNTFVNADFRFMLTPAMADVISIRNLYPYLQTATRTGDTTYGLFPNTGNAALDSATAIGADMFMNIVDDGGTDTLDFSATGAAQTINLTAETFSSVLGGTMNLSIARGVTIENANGGSNADSIYGNEAGNVVAGNNGNDTLWGYGGDDDLFGGQGEDNIKGGGGDDVLAGGTESDLIYGEDGKDTLGGQDGSDTLYGGANDDALKGGGGADTLFGDDGIDTADYGDSTVGMEVHLGLNGAVGTGIRGTAEGDRLYGIENLSGSNHDDNLVGNEGVNVLEGRDGDDTLIGLRGADVLKGGAGDDMADYTDSEAAVSVNLVTGRGSGGDAEADTYESIEDVYGTVYSDTFVLSAAANEVFSHFALLLTDDRDTVDYRNSTAAVTVDLLTNANSGGYAQGDLLYGIANAIGSSYGDTLSGTAGDNYLNGAGGTDTMTGRGGSDTYVVDDVNDRVVEAAADAGTDTVLAVVSYSLDGKAVENLTLLGAAAINATGNALNNVLTGNSGANLLSGGAAADIMIGGAGGDTFLVDNPGDRVVEVASDAGTDTVLAVCSFSLDGTAAENLILAGTAAINGLGNALANALTGNAAANILNGGAGADTMTGGAGSDTYVVDNSGDRCIEANGAAGIDTVLSTTSYSLAGSHLENLTLVGGANIYGLGNSIANTITGNGGANLIDGMGGRDTLTGNGGADTFLFRTLTDSGLGSARDTITDFAKGIDKIDLSLIDANAAASGNQAFGFIGTGGFTGQAGQLHQITVNGNTIVEGDVDGNRAADFQIQLNGLHTLQATDFVL